MSVIPIRTESRTQINTDAYSPLGPVLIAATNPVFIEDVRVALPDALTFSSGRDVLDTIINDGGYSALFVDFVPLQDQMTGMGLMRTLRERGISGLPIWLMADSWHEAQLVWAKEKLGARGYCQRNSIAILTSLGKNPDPSVFCVPPSPIPHPDFDQSIHEVLTASFRKFAGPAAELHLSEVLGNSHNRGSATSLDAAIQMLAGRLTIASRRQAFIDSVGDLKKKIATEIPNHSLNDDVSQPWIEEVQKVLKNFVGGLGAIHILAEADQSFENSNSRSRGIFVAELMRRISNDQRREQFRRDLIKKGLINI